MLQISPVTLAWVRGILFGVVLYLLPTVPESAKQAAEKKVENTMPLISAHTVLVVISQA